MSNQSDSTSVVSGNILPFSVYNRKLGDRLKQVNKNSNLKSLES